MLLMRKCRMVAIVHPGGSINRLHSGKFIFTAGSLARLPNQCRGRC